MNETPLGQLARRYADWTSAEGRADAVGVRTADALAALMTGSRTAEGAAIMALDDWGGGVLGVLARRVATTRLTELDDIHMPTCTTPGSVVVPAAVTVAAHVGAGPAAYARAVEIGYDAMTRLGAAIDGAHTVYRGVWPTYFCAPFATAAVVASLLELDADATRNALAIALTRASGLTSGVAGAPLARWLTVGDAARAGAGAALAARAGFVADVELDRVAAGAGLALDADALRDERESAIDAVSVKPFPTAKQSLSATEAALSLAARVPADAVGSVRVEVPTAYARMVANAPRTSSRLSRIASARWNVALAMARPGALDDVERAISPAEPALARLAGLVEVVADAHLDALYPRRWPAQVIINEVAELVVDATGDPPANGRDAVAAKWRRRGVPLTILDGLDARALDAALWTQTS